MLLSLYVKVALDIYGRPGYITVLSSLEMESYIQMQLHVMIFGRF